MTTHLQGALRQEGGGLFPSLSFARDEQVEANFGQKPFVHRPPERVLSKPGGSNGTKAWRRFRAVAALIPSPLSMEAFPLGPSPGPGVSDLMSPSQHGPGTGRGPALMSPPARVAALSEEDNCERLVDRLMFLGLPVEWCLKALDEPDVKNVRFGTCLKPPLCYDSLIH